MSELRFPEDALLNLVLWGDPQIASMHPERERNLEAACRTVASLPAPADALVVLGDTAEYGRATEYAGVQRCLSIAAKGVKHIYCVPGNHDIRARHFAGQCARFARFLDSVPNAAVPPRGRYWFSSDLNGCRLLFLGADKTCFEGSYLSPTQLHWLRLKLAEAKRLGMPALVFNHQPLKRTNGLPLTWAGAGSWRGSVGDQSDALRAVFKNNGPVIYCTGHLHYGVSRYTVEHSGDLHMISAPAVGCQNHGPNDAPAQGIVLSVYKDRAEGRGVYFLNGAPMPESVPGAVFSFRLKAVTVGGQET